MTEFEPRFLAPPGWTTGNFKNAADIQLHYGYAQPAQPPVRGTVVVVCGFSEFIEKYFESIRDFLARGYAVYALDWRGQGRSDRYFADSQKPYSFGFANDVEDLKVFVSNVVTPDPDQTLILSAHSMGANIGLLFLQKYPDIFSSAIFSAPMLGVQTRGFPRWLARAIIKLGFHLGFDKHYAPGGNDTHGEINPLEHDIKSHDPVRRLVQHQWILKDPALDLGDATIGWLYHAVQAMDEIRKPGFLESIQTPVLLGIPTGDRIVRRADMEAAVRRLPHVQAVHLEDCHHEIWMERDIYRQLWLQAIENFLPL